ncbi:alpha-keto acid decarboxylase family protein, partial [Staphylococcus aureus]|nr:alpha-keto acid decarboxylase family protein [Staphylococcus aureus]
VLFVINNDGYTVGRLIQGMCEPYNEIQMWDYKALPAVFGGKNVGIHDVESSKDLQGTFNAINGPPDVMHFVEVKMSVG